MDFGKAFTYVFDDEEWLKKIGLGGLLALIPVFGFFVVLGWGVEITKRVIKGDPEVLPEWDDFGGFLSMGFQAFLIFFVYTLPVILISICTSLPFFFKGADNSFNVAFGFVAVCFSCVSLFYSLAAYLVLPAAIGKFAATGELSEAFKLAEIFKVVKDNLGDYGLVLLGGLVASFVGSLGSIACLIGVIFTMVYSVAINGHLWGQAYLVSGAGTPAAPVEPLPKAG
jgi:hypothetical protein